jgi:GNAT superfamily N-acetyltransferase
LSEYRVVPYHRELEHEIVRLWQESQGQKGIDHRLTVFRWFTERNPSLRGRPAYWCLHDGSRIVGMHGHMPVVFAVDGQERLGHMAHDDLLHPSARGKGLGQVLFDGVRTAAPDFAAAMWLNEVNHRSHSKSGWIDVPGFRHYVRFLDAGRLARKFSKPALASLARVGGPLALRLADLPGRLRRRSSLRLESLERFDARFDALWERAKPQLGIAVRRDAEYLNWRYVAMPTHRHERLAAITARGEAAGYVVWRPIPAGGGLVVWVLDVGWDPWQRGVLETLLLAVVAAAREQHAIQVVCVAAHPTVVRTLRSLGFLHNRRAEFHMVSNWEGVFARAEVTNIRRWHLTLGDADGDIWSEE